MLVRKKNPEWFPSENRYLEVGQTIDITDPYSLILNGDVEAINENGDIVTAYDLYGIVTGQEMDEFKQWKRLKAAQQEQERLLKEQAELQKFVTQQQTTQPTTTPEAEKPKSDPVDEMSWQDLMAKAKSLGLYKVGMKKEEVIEAIKNA